MTRNLETTMQSRLRLNDAIEPVPVVEWRVLDVQSGRNGLVQKAKHALMYAHDLEWTTNTFPWFHTHLFNDSHNHSPQSIHKCRRTHG
jgi:hypothetical protein